MMSPEFSRRMGRVVHTSAWMEFKLANWDKADQAVELMARAEKVEDLPDWIQELIKKAEAEKPEDRFAYLFPKKAQEGAKQAKDRFRGILK